MLNACLSLVIFNICLLCTTYLSLAKQRYNRLSTQIENYPQFMLLCSEPAKSSHHEFTISKISAYFPQSGLFKFCFIHTLSWTELFFNFYLPRAFSSLSTTYCHFLLGYLLRRTHLEKPRATSSIFCFLSRAR